MAIKIYEEGKRKKDVYLKFRQEGDRVIVVALNENGEFLKNILDISENGIHLCYSANNAGIATDEDGKAIIL